MESGRSCNRLVVVVGDGAAISDVILMEFFLCVP